MQVGPDKIISQHSGPGGDKEGVAKQIEVQNVADADGEILVAIPKSESPAVPAQLDDPGLLSLTKGGKSTVRRHNDPRDHVDVQVHHIDRTGGQVHQLDHAPGFRAAEPQPPIRDGQGANIGINQALLNAQGGEGLFLKVENECATRRGRIDLALMVAEGPGINYGGKVPPLTYPALSLPHCRG